MRPKHNTLLKFSKAQAKQTPGLFRTRDNYRKWQLEGWTQLNAKARFDWKCTLNFMHPMLGGTRPERISLLLRSRCARYFEQRSKGYMLLSGKKYQCSLLPRARKYLGLSMHMFFSFLCLYQVILCDTVSSRLWTTLKHSFSILLRVLNVYAMIPPDSLLESIRIIYNRYPKTKWSFYE